MAGQRPRDADLELRFRPPGAVRIDLLKLVEVGFLDSGLQKRTQFFQARPMRQSPRQHSSVRASRPVGAAFQIGYGGEERRCGRCRLCRITLSVKGPVTQIGYASRNPDSTSRLLTCHPANALRAAVIEFSRGSRENKMILAAAAFSLQA